MMRYAHHAMQWTLLREMSPWWMALILLISWPATSHGQKESGRSVPAASISIARKLVELMLADAATNVSTSALPADPSVPRPAMEARTEKVMRDWARRSLPADTVTEMRARALAREFSSAELHQLRVVYESPIGRRFASARVALRADVAKQTSGMVSAHRQELRDSLRAAIRKARP